MWLVQKRKEGATDRNTKFGQAGYSGSAHVLVLQVHRIDVRPIFRVNLG